MLPRATRSGRSTTSAAPPSRRSTPPTPAPPANLSPLSSARMLVGIRPYAVAIILILLTAVGAQLFTGQTDLQLKTVGIAAGAALVIAVIGALLIRAAAKSASRRIYVQFGTS